ncbi:MAG: ECF transporter S component [Ruminococcus sp.]|nr:ECF transporter S component [Ruminococcus sp.]
MIVIKNARARNAIRAAVPFVLIPCLAYAGTMMFDKSRHLLISLLAAAAAILLFAAGFDRKKTGARRMVICAVMTALAFAGRFIPFLNPITAMAVITGIYMGSEAGFLVGSMAALLSNFYFGQGPWTVFQMLAWGLIGFISGVMSKPLKANKAVLLIYGALSGVFYSLIMDVWTVLWYSRGFDIKMYGAAIISALPYTASYAVSNVLFLAVLFKPFGEKLERVRVKYGI